MHTPRGDRARTIYRDGHHKNVIAFGDDDLARMVGEYVAARQLCEKQQERMRLHTDRFREWYGGRVDRLAIDTSVLNDWLCGLSEELSPSTVNNHRQTILSLLRFDTDDHEPLPRSDRIRRQRVPEKINPAFRLDEIRQMLAKAPKYKPVTMRTYGRGLAGDEIPRHKPDGTPWRIWWPAFVRAGYCSGQYLSDLRLLRWCDVAADGSCTITRHKTGRLLSFRLDEKSLAACRKLNGGEYVLPWDHDLGTYFPREFKRFCEFCGVRILGPKSLRRSAITYTYIQSGEEAARTLAGHKSFTTTAAHYIDYSIAKRPISEPPTL